ncbi:MAG: heavy metal translocating P-type ATPase [Halarchaeum sp.]
MTLAGASTCTFTVERRGGRGDGAARSLEEALADLEGVGEASVSFRTGRIAVTYDPAVVSRDGIERTIRARGIDVREVRAPSSADAGGDSSGALASEAGDAATVDEATAEGVASDADDGDAEEDEVSTRGSLRREAAFVAVTLAGMLGGLAAGWLGWPTPVMWACYAFAYAFGGWYGLRGALEALRHGAVDIDLLMIVAAAGALSIGAPFEGAMLLFLFSLSNVLQHYAIGRSRRAIRSLVSMRPETALVRRDGEEVSVPVDEVAVGDVFVVGPGDRIPLDGVVASGESSVDQASLTGESMPVAKSPGDEVFGGTIVEGGSLEVTVTRRARESAIARLIDMVEHAQGRKAPTQRLIDRFEQPYVLAVFAMTALAVAVPTVLGAPFDPTFYRAMTLMVAASPCAVVISTPAAVLSAIASGGRQGVLFKGGEHVETAATVSAVAFDKTGTLTEGNTRLTDVRSRDESDADALLADVAAVQRRSEHHLARATVDAAAERGLAVPDASDFRAVAGKGVRATVDGYTLHVGNRSYVETVLGGDVDGLDEGVDALASLEADGKTSVLAVAEDDAGARVVGWLAYTDTVREGAADVVARLRELGVEHVVMLTGDNERVAARIAESVGIDEVHAALLPEEKVERVEGLVERYDGVAMVGDGVNDAPALATASLGVAMGAAGTDVALETADVVLMGDDLAKIPYVLGLGRKTRRVLLSNFAIAFGAIAVMVSTILLGGIPLPLAVVGHEGSTVLVSLNGLRLLGYRE